MRTLRFLPLLILASVTSSVAATVPTVQSSDTAVYRNPILNIEFTHPKSWRVSNLRRNESRITIPIEGVKEGAILEILPVTFEAEKDIWQVSQRTVVENAKYELVRQWEEEILGVPMLLTRYTFPSNQGAKTAVSALLYNNWPRKMLFRLTTGVFEFEKAEFELRQVLQTIRTIDGSAFAPNDPNAPRPAEGSKPVPVEAKVTRVVVIDNSGNRRQPTNVPAPTVEVDAKAAGRDLKLVLPRGWTATAGADGEFTLSHSDLGGGSVKATVLSSLDSSPADRALLQATNASLAGFTSVDSRRERVPSPTPRQAEASWVVRVGRAEDAFRGTFDAALVSGNFYVLLKFEGGDRRTFDRARQALESLLLGSDLRQAN